MPALALTDAGQPVRHGQVLRRGARGGGQADRRRRLLAAERDRPRQALPPAPAVRLARRLPAAVRPAVARLAAQPAPRPGRAGARVAARQRRPDRAFRRRGRRRRPGAAFRTMPRPPSASRRAGRSFSRAATTSSCSAPATRTARRWFRARWRSPRASACRWSRPTRCSSSTPATSRRTRRAYASPPGTSSPTSAGRSASPPEQYFKRQDEMAKLFADIPQALDNTIEIARRCNLAIELGKSRLPAFPTPGGVERRRLPAAAGARRDEEARHWTTSSGSSSS